MWWKVRCRQSTRVGKCCWWRVWGATLDSWVRGDTWERCRERRLGWYGRGALWRRQRPATSRTLGGCAPWEGRGGGARESPPETALGHKSLSAISPRPIQPMNGWKGQPSEVNPKLSFSLRHHYKVKSKGPPFILSSKSRHILGVKWSLLIIPKGDHDSARPLPGKPNAGSTYTPTCSQDQEKVLPKPLHCFQDPLGELMDSSELPLWLSW